MKVAEFTKQYKNINSTIAIRVQQIDAQMEYILLVHFVKGKLYVYGTADKGREFRQLNDATDIVGGIRCDLINDFSMLY